MSLRVRTSFLLAALAATTLQAAGPPPPVWRPGQQWTLSVKVETRQSTAGLPGDATPPGHRGFVVVPSAPTLWYLKVVEAFEAPGGEFVRHRLVGHRSGHDEPEFEVRFVTRLEGGHPVARALEIVNLRLGPEDAYTRDLRELSTEPAAALLEGTEVPLSWPYLAPDVPAVKVFPVTQMVGGLPFAMDVEQRIRSGKEAEEIARRVGVRFGDRKVWVVELGRKADNVYCKQIWVEGDPWPARVVSNHLESVLLGTGAGG